LDINGISIYCSSFSFQVLLLGVLSRKIPSKCLLFIPNTNSCHNVHHTSSTSASQTSSLSTDRQLNKLQHYPSSDTLSSSLSESSSSTGHSFLTSSKYLSTLNVWYLISPRCSSIRWNRTRSCIRSFLTSRSFFFQAATRRKRVRLPGGCRL
jgi:hypothetical protein